MARRKHNFGILAVAVIFGSLLWGYVSLSGEYEADLQVRLNVEPPTHQAMISTIPRELTVRVRTTGLQLVNLKYLSSTPVCNIDLEDIRPSSEAMYTVDRDDIVRAIALPGAVQIVSLQPTTLSIATGEVFTKTVPIRLRMNVACREGFVVVGDPVVEPSMVEIRGTKSVVESIESWNTELLALDDLYQSHTAKIAMSDSLTMLLRVKPDVITASFDVQQLAEIEIHDIQVRSVNDDPTMVISPERISVTIRGGTNVVAALLSSDIEAVIPVDAAGPIAPTFRTPQGVSVVSTSPAYVQVVSTSR